MERVSSIKFFGIIIAYSFKWNLQVASVAKKVATANGVLYQMRKTLAKSLRIVVFNVLIQLHLSYGTLEWGCGGGNNRLEKILLHKRRHSECIWSKETRVNKNISGIGYTKIVFNNNKILPVHNM